ncbi:hypothetical protein CDL15_Pgr021782 [Punica granatum]|uniref:Uncharacterized protein n=1 Tax=Punica granatum TaxID=22663 RepID=A0A218WRZ1_PUNGR|nr:hypothetical protein CDL15_Pgr021782 [Punica granatum]PKI52057.1 hypothetical protein CRG98_027473 [Punica granatum]
MPTELCLLPELHVLDLAANDLEGTIPDCFGNMSGMTQVASPDKFCPRSPDTWDQERMVESHLNLSNNDLTGRVPNGNQLDTLYEPETSICAGNPLLCGDPLPNKCPGDEVPTPSKSSGEEEEEDGDKLDSTEKVMFYGVVAAGFATGFWAVIGVLVFKKEWRAALFRFAEEIAEWAYNVGFAVKVAESKRRMRST